MDFDFCGYVTRNNIRCSDGRTIRQDAFKSQDGTEVPLVWQHRHDSPDNVLGHVHLENREDGVYGYAVTNETPNGKQALALVEHGDVNSFSIFANDLVEQGGDVMHGVIREVSLVLAGANPGAKIENLQIAHSDGYIEESETSADMCFPSEIYLAHAEGDEGETSTQSDSSDDSGETVQDVIDTMTEKQKNVLYALVGTALEGEELPSDGDTDENSAAQSAINEGENVVKHNVFDKTDTEPTGTVLSHSQIHEIWKDAESMGSLKKSVLAHAQEYGITNIEILFPEAKNADTPPEWVKRRTEWVAGVLNGTHKLPYARFKSRTADITQDTARARGYIKGNLKKDEFFEISQRETGPQTIYKRQKFDRDDLIDVTDFDIVPWVKGEMRLMLDEEIARAILIGDGREVDDEDKIREDKIRPIWTDDDFYTIKVQLEADDTPDAISDKIARAMEDYEGTGTPTFYTTRKRVNDFMLQRDQIGHRLYDSKQQLADELGVSGFVDVDVMKGQTRTDDEENEYELFGIIVNIGDYDTGTDKGGLVTMFDDFDIDFNQYKYLLETRLSGALVKPHTAIAVEVKKA